jgi:Tfp pilus assembly protein PilP
MRGTPPKVLAVAALFFAATALGACGESAQDKAKSEVCDAREEISKQITKLQGLTLSSNTVTEAKASFESIGKALKKAKNAQSDLAPARREQVESATKTLQQDLSGLGSELASNLTAASVEAGLSKLKAAVGAFAADFKQAMGPINCS